MGWEGSEGRVCKEEGKESAPLGLASLKVHFLIREHLPWEHVGGADRNILLQPILKRPKPVSPRTHHVMVSLLVAFGNLLYELFP